MLAWWVLEDGRYVDIDRHLDLLSDAAVELEDLMQASADLSEVLAESKRIVVESRRSRRLRTTTLRVVRNVAV